MTSTSGGDDRASRVPVHQRDLAARAADLAHDLAGPLQLATGYLSILRGTASAPLGPDTLDSVDRAQAALLRAGELLRELAVTITAASMPAHVVVDPSRLLQEVAGALRHDRRIAAFAIDVGDLGPGAEVRADPLHLCAAFELVLCSASWSAMTAGPCGDRWQLIASAPGRVKAQEAGPPLWRLIVERQGGTAESGDDGSLRLTLPLSVPTVRSGDLAARPAPDVAG